MIRLFGLRDGAGQAAERKLLAQALRQTWGADRLPPIARGPWGKPWFPDWPEWQFNLSHSGSFLLCALSDSPVGVDIEMIRPRRPLLLEGALTPEERRWCMEQRDPWPRFYLLWTRRESLCKHSGRGLTLPVREIRVPRPPAQSAGTLRFQNYYGSSWAACLCGQWDAPPPLEWLILPPDRGEAEPSVPNFSSCPHKKAAAADG